MFANSTQAFGGGGVTNNLIRVAQHSLSSSEVKPHLTQFSDHLPSPSFLHSRQRYVMTIAKIGFDRDPAPASSPISFTPSCAFVFLLASASWDDSFRLASVCLVQAVRERQGECRANRRINTYSYHNRDVSLETIQDKTRANGGVRAGGEAEEERGTWHRRILIGYILDISWI